MKAIRKLGLLFCTAILIAAFGSSAKAGEFDKLTIVTFSAPVELPGTVVLPAGAYVFKLLDNSGDRNIVQVFNEDQNRIYATLLTLPAERLEQTDKTIVDFYETEGNAPSALKTWFIPSETSGHEFVYPTVRAAELADIAKQPATVMSANSTQSQAHP
jgi:hypothetical protein